MVQAIHLSPPPHKMPAGYCLMCAGSGKGYEFQTRNYEDGFILKCCDLVLQYHPVNVQALLLKAKTLKRIYSKPQQEKSSSALRTYLDMEELYTKLFDLGYLEMRKKCTGNGYSRFTRSRRSTALGCYYIP